VYSASPQPRARCAQLTLIHVVCARLQDKRWSWVHVDDLAQAYVRAAQNRGAATGQIFDVGEPHGPQFEELLRAAKAYTGV